MDNRTEAVGSWNGGRLRFGGMGGGAVRVGGVDLDRGATPGGREIEIDARVGVVGGSEWKGRPRCGDQGGLLARIV